MMNERAWMVLVLSLACGCAESNGREPGSGDSGVCVSMATLPAVTCADGVLTREGGPPDLTELADGTATVLRLHVAADGTASLAIEVGATVVTLSLPVAPMLTVGDTVEIERPGSGAIVLRSEGELRVYVGPGTLDLDDYDPPVLHSALIEANREGTPLTIDVAGVPLTLEAACGAWVQHPGGSFDCPRVPLAVFSVRHGDTIVGPGAVGIAPLDDGRALAIQNRGVHAREDDTTCSPCADFWMPSFGVTLVVADAE